MAEVKILRDPGNGARGSRATDVRPTDRAHEDQPGREKEMKALSLQQPYAWLILQRYRADNPRRPLKALENRSWHLPRSFAVPQRVWIHASLTMYDVGLDEIKAELDPDQWYRCKGYLRNLYSEAMATRPGPARHALPFFGHILGSVVITGEVTHSDDPWFFGPVAFSLESPDELRRPIPYKGRHRFFDVDLSLLTVDTTRR